MTHLSIVSRLPRAIRPLSRRLPVLVVTITAVMMATILYLGFQRVHRLAADVTLAHLQVSSHQLTSTLQSSGTRLRREATRLASIPEVGRAASPFATATDTAAARTALSAELERSPQTASLAVWSRQGRLMVAVGDPSLAASAPPASTELMDSPRDSAPVVAPLVVRGDSVYIALTGRISGTAGSDGYVVAMRRISSNPQALDLLRHLVGPEARILFSNIDGSVWTDFSRRVGDVGVVADSGTGEHIGPSGIVYLHSVERIPRTPWRIMLDVPRRSATATAGHFVLEMVAVAAGLMLLGAFVIWIVIHRSLKPLSDVTEAVVALARGDSTKAVESAGDDEVGRLAIAFNSMASQVQASARELASRAEALEESNRELKDSEQRYRILVDHMPDAILLHRDQKIAFANRACLDLFGVGAADNLIGRSMLDFIDPKDRAALISRSENIQAGSVAPAREYRIRRANGKPVLVEATSMHLSLGGKGAVQTILHDVTERRLLEEQVRQSQKMDAIGRLAGGVAHDFNNVLTVIDAHADFATRPGTDEAERFADIAEIRKASGSAARLTRQLLAFSRQQSIDPVSVDLNDAVQALLSMLERLIGETVSVTAHLFKPLWCVCADRSHMEQVIMNLSVNARDAMPDGGTLKVTTSNADIGLDYRTPSGELVPPGQYVQLAVEDSGVGMTAEIQSKIFEPFFTTKPPGRGTGLGLSTVYGIIKQSGGFIWVYSEVNRGTAFRILLPRDHADDQLPSTARTSEHRIPAVNARILLVEDQVAVRGAISRILRDAGFVVLEAADAEDAETVLLSEEDSVDLIVTDMMLPGKMGAELASGPLVVGRGTPVVIMSGYSEEFTNREWRLPPNASFINKPVSPTDLIRLIRKLIS